MDIRNTTMATTPASTNAFPNSTEMSNTTDAQGNGTDVTSGAPTTMPSTPRETTSTSTSTDVTVANQSDEPGSGAGPIVGGIIGGIVAVVIVVALVVLIFRWRRRKSRDKRKKPKPMAPGVSDLEKFDQMRAGTGNGVPLYTNIDSSGAPNEKTDPALDEDGYLQKKRQKKKKKKRGAERHQSIPVHPAPPAPSQTRKATDDDAGAGMEAYENVRNKGGIMSSCANQSTESPASKKSEKRQEEKRANPGYVNAGQQPLATSAGADTAKHYANVESRFGNQQSNYANVKAGQEILAKQVSEELYENPND